MDTYVDVSDPLQGTDHGRFRDVVTSVYGQSQEGDTGSGLSGSWIAERCGNGAEVRLHDQSYGDNKEEEDTTLKAWVDQVKVNNPGGTHKN